ncbi:hypothetical protein FGO68_gene2201 [Halteria grandinella]|uniref:RING-type domain-containing protein n=1 Tax=Halteria grandinella TaxID=5974 RepID=A0A8J8SXA3_HALGN|nr:hypothetical protein FGO68_gene2201 [Halteria grandinella]
MIDTTANSATKKMMSGFKNLICPLCLNFMYKSTTTACGHSFCERCLDEYLILRKTCFLCEEVIRYKPLVSCFTIDNVIEQLITKLGNNHEQPNPLAPPDSLKTIRERWDTQKREHKLWSDGKRLDPANLEPGMKVDIRDTEYVWCTGLLKIKVECANREPLVIVHYEGWNKYYDEIVKVGSPRLAPHGFYTSRDDLPRYCIEGDNAMVAVIVNRIIPPQQQQPQLQQQPKKPEDPSQQKSPQQIRRESNALLGDQIEQKLEDFFKSCEARTRVHHANQASRQTQSNAVQGHPPVVYVRNSINTLSEVYGGQSIYDSLLGQSNANSSNQLDNGGGMGIGIGGGRPHIRPAMAAAISNPRDGLMNSMQSIVDQLQRRLTNNRNEVPVRNPQYIVQEIPVVVPAVAAAAGQENAQEQRQEQQRN